MYENVFGNVEDDSQHKCIGAIQNFDQPILLIIERIRKKQKNSSRNIFEWQKMCQTIVLTCVLFALLLPVPIR